jgi:hypothetical protein
LFIHEVLAAAMLVIDEEDKQVVKAILKTV